MTKEEAYVRKKIIQSTLNGRVETSALFAVFCECWHGTLVEAREEEKKAAAPRGFTFEAPPDFVTPVPLDPNFDWNFFGHLSDPSASSSENQE